MKDIMTYIGWWALLICAYAALGFMVGASIAQAL